MQYLFHKTSIYFRYFLIFHTTITHTMLQNVHTIGQVGRIVLTACDSL